MSSLASSVRWTYEPITMAPGVNVWRPPTRIDEVSEVERRAGRKLAGSNNILDRRAQIGRPEFDLCAGGWRDLRLKERVVDILPGVVVVAEAVRVRVELPNAVGKAIVNSREDQVVRLRPVISEKAVANEPYLVAGEQPRELVEARAREAGVQEREAVVGEAGLNRNDVERLQQLRLQELTVSRNRVPRQAQISVRQQTVSREIPRIRPAISIPPPAPAARSRRLDRFSQGWRRVRPGRVQKNRDR